MKKFNSLITLTLLLSLLFVGCQQQDDENSTLQDAPDQILVALESQGFNVIDQPPISYNDGFLVEGDIYLTNDQILNRNKKNGKGISISEKQYSTNNLVTTNGNRTITVFAREGGGLGFDTATSEAIDLAIERYNTENLEITFERVSSQRNADIVISRLNFFLELFGVLGFAGFPTDNGDPFDEIALTGRLASIGISKEGIASIVAHELGHCIGFRHTDYFDRSISCGGDPVDEGAGDIGANLIPGTPADATLEAASWMLSCFDGSDRPFNEDDQTALNFLY